MAHETHWIIQQLKVTMGRDIDLIIERTKARLPDVKVQQHWVRDPRKEDDGVWWFSLPGVKKDIQIESSYGACPFLVEHDDMKSSSEAETARTVEEAVEKTVSYLSSLTT
jgi:hypothetical protein